MQQTEVHALQNEIRQLRLQQVLSVENAESGSISSVAELRTTVAGLQQEVSIKFALRERKEKLNQEVIQLRREK